MQFFFRTLSVMGAVHLQMSCVINISIFYRSSLSYVNEALGVGLGSAEGCLTESKLKASFLKN